jgi:hypothetical protein
VNKSKFSAFKSPNFETKQVGLLRGLYLNKPKMFLARFFRVPEFVTTFPSAFAQYKRLNPKEKQQAECSTCCSALLGRVR